MEDIRKDLFEATISHTSNIGAPIEYKGKPRIFIEKISVVPKEKMFLMNPEEREMIRGLGRRCLFLSIGLIVERFKMTPDDLVGLVASGGTVTELDRDRVRYYIENYTKDHLIAIGMDIENVTHSDEAYDEYYQQSPEEISYTIVQVENNKKLAEYYENSYGMKIVDDYGGEIEMLTTVKSFVDTIKG